MIKNKNVANDAAISPSKILGGGLVGAGRVFYVAPATSNMYTYWNGKVPSSDLYTTLAAAYAQTVTNRNDVIILSPDQHTVTSMLTIAKNRIQFIGVGASGRSIQQSARIVMGVTGVATDLAPVLVTGTRNSFVNIKAENASTTNESLYGWIENGEGTYYENFMSVKTAGLDDAGHAHFWMAGDACSGRNLTFGHSTVTSSAAAYGILIDGKTGGATTTVHELMWENVRVNMKVATGVAATSCFIKIKDVNAMLCNNVIDGFRGYHQVVSGTNTILTDAVLAPSTIVKGVLCLIDPAFFGATGVIDNASDGVQIANSGGTAAAAGGLATNLT